MSFSSEQMHKVDRLMVTPHDLKPGGSPSVSTPESRCLYLLFHLGLTFGGRWLLPERCDSPKAKTSASLLDGTQMWPVAQLWMGSTSSSF